MPDVALQEMLKDHRLRNTQCRIDILSIFFDCDFALSNADIENKVSDSYDRVTVYRTLKTFVDKGLIHKIPDDNGSPKYALCKDDCTVEIHRHEHAHFKCVLCGQTTCLDQSHIPGMRLPLGYKMLEMNMLITGYCKDCGSK